MKVWIAVGAAAAAGGAIYLAYRYRQNMLVQQGVVNPVPVGITSIYSTDGSSGTTSGIRLSSAAVVGGVTLNAGSPTYKGGAGAPPVGGSAASAAFAAAAAAMASMIPAPTAGPTTETRSGRGHF